MYNMQLHYDNRYVQRIQTDNAVGTLLFRFFLFFFLPFFSLFLSSVFLNVLIEGIVLNNNLLINMYRMFQS